MKRRIIIRSIVCFLILAFVVSLLIPKTIKIYRPVLSNSLDKHIRSDKIPAGTTYGERYLIHDDKLYLHFRTVKYIPIFSAILDRQTVKWKNNDLKELILQNPSLNKYFLLPNEENLGVPWIE